MTDKKSEVRQFLSVFADKVAGVSESMTSKDMYNFLHCCSHISDGTPEFERLLLLFLDRYKKSDPLKERGLFIAALHPLYVLFPLRCRKEPTDAILKLFRTLAEKLSSLNEDDCLVANCHTDKRGEYLQVERVVRAFVGIAGYSSESEEIKILINEIVTYAEGVNLSPWQACRVMESLSEKSGENHYMPRLLSKLHSVIYSECRDGRVEPVPNHMICAALSGLRSTKNDTAEVKIILNKFARSLDERKNCLTVNCIVSAMSGLRKMQLPCTAVENILHILATCFSNENIQLRHMDIIDILISIECIYRNSASTTELNFETKSIPHKVLVRLINEISRKIMPSRQQFFTNKVIIDQLKALSFMQLRGDGVAGLRLALRKKGMI